MGSKKAKLPRGLSRRKDSSIYWISLNVGGRQERISTGTDDLDVAKRILAKAQADRATGRFNVAQVGDGALTFRGLRDLWINRPSTQKKVSLYNDIKRFDVMVDLMGGGTLINSLTLDDIERLQDKLLARTVGKHKKKPISASAVGQYMRLLRAAFRHASRCNKIHGDPMNGIKYAPSKRKTETFTPEEFQLVIDTPRLRPEVRTIALICWWTPIRAGAARTLTWDQVDLEANVLRFDVEGVVNKTKVDVPIAMPLIPVLQEWREHRLSQLGKGEKLPANLFDIRGDNLSEAFVNACKKNGIQNKSMHCLRRTSLTNLKDFGYQPSDVRDLSGHKTLTVLMNNYQVSGIDKARQMIQALEQHRNVLASSATNDQQPTIVSKRFNLKPEEKVIASKTFNLATRPGVKRIFNSK